MQLIVTGRILKKKGDMITNLTEIRETINKTKHPKATAMHMDSGHELSNSLQLSTEQHPGLSCSVEQNILCRKKKKKRRFLILHCKLLFPTVAVGWLCPGSLMCFSLCGEFLSCI